MITLICVQNPYEFVLNDAFGCFISCCYSTKEKDLYDIDHVEIKSRSELLLDVKDVAKQIDSVPERTKILLFRKTFSLGKKMDR